MQTSTWGEFRREWGNEVFETKFGIVTLHKIPFIGYKIGIFEKGPMPTKNQLLELKALATKHNLIFIKLEPNYVIKKDNISCADEGKIVKLLTSFAVVRGRKLFTPSTFWIDLSKSEDDLLRGFHHKTRYNIRLAQRQGVKVVEDNSDKAFEKYLKLTFETAKRQGFYAHTEKYHRLMWKHLKAAGIAHLLVASYKKEIITTWILFVWKDFLYYPYGASSDKHKEVMANNLMMWEAIRFGKKHNLKTFDLWGREEGKGFTRFKEGYNPKVVEFIGTWDLVINKPLYLLYKIADLVRWFILRLR